MKFTNKPLFLKIIFAITIAIILFISSVSYKHIRALHDSNEIVEHTYRVLIKIEHVFTKIKNIEIDRRNYLLTHDKKLLHQIEFDKVEIKQNLEQLREITSDNPYHFQTTKKLESLIAKKLKVVDEVLDPNFDLKNIDKVKDNIYRGKAVMDEISAIIRNLRQSETHLLETRSLKSDQVNKYTPLVNLLTFFVTIVLLILAIIKINRDLKEANINNEKLILANETANLAEQIGNYGTWQLNVETKKYTFSENEYRLLGYEPNSLEDNYEGFMNRIHPEDLYYVQGIVSEMINHETLSPFTYRIIRNDGEVRYLRASGKMIKNLKNEKILLGITSDVTEEIENQKNISEKNREFEAKTKEEKAKKEQVIIDIKGKKLKVINIETTYVGVDGKPLRSSEYLELLIGVLGRFYNDEQTLRDIWSNPKNRKELLEKLKDMNIDESQLEDLKDIFEAKNSDIYDVLAHLSFNHNIKTRDERAIAALNSKFIEKYQNEKAKDFIEFILEKYRKYGFKELEENKLSTLIEQSGFDRRELMASFGDFKIRDEYFELQKEIYK
jgi:PAS domain S-box-containing protein